MAGSCRGISGALSAFSGTLYAHPGWERFLIIALVFLCEITLWGLCQDWVAESPEQMVQILFWMVWLNCSHVPLELFTLPVGT